MPFRGRAAVLLSVAVFAQRWPVAAAGADPKCVRCLGQGRQWCRAGFWTPAGTSTGVCQELTNGYGTCMPRRELCPGDLAPRLWACARITIMGGPRTRLATFTGWAQKAGSVFVAIILFYSDRACPPAPLY